MTKIQKKTIYEALGRGPVHPFPARMAPGIALESVSGSKRSMRVLDPMMGSGTVVALARSKGHRACGVDIDPLAVLIARVWTTAVDCNLVQQKAKTVLERAQLRFATLALKDAYPRGADAETKAFLRYWFDNYARRQLAALAESIRRTRDEKIKDALWCAFSRLIITKQSGVSLAKDLAHSRPHRSFELAPIKPFSNFMSAVETVLENCIAEIETARGPRAATKLGDARALDLRDGCIDLVLTSPPYLNAIDYIRCSKFSLVWMGSTTIELRTVRNKSVGTEVGDYEGSEFSARILRQLRLERRLSSRHKALLTRYIEDMGASLSEVSRVLVPGGKAIYVVGENTIRGTYIRNSNIVIKLARRAGLVLHKKATRALPPNRRYLPPPSSGTGKAALDGRMRREVVLSFRKPRRGARKVFRQKSWRARRHNGKKQSIRG